MRNFVFARAHQRFILCRRRVQQSGTEIDGGDNRSIELITLRYTGIGQYGIVATIFGLQARGSECTHDSHVHYNCDAHRNHSDEYRDIGIRNSRTSHRRSTRTRLDITDLRYRNGTLIHIKTKSHMYTVKHTHAPPPPQCRPTRNKQLLLLQHQERQSHNQCITTNASLPLSWGQSDSMETSRQPQQPPPKPNPSSTYQTAAKQLRGYG